MAAGGQHAGPAATREAAAAILNTAFGAALAADKKPVSPKERLSTNDGKPQELLPHNNAPTDHKAGKVQQVKVGAMHRRCWHKYDTKKSVVSAIRAVCACDHPPSSSLPYACLSPGWYRQWR